MTPLFFMYWIGFSILVLIAGGLAFAWSRKSGYFRDQDRARYLALWAEVPEEDKQHTEPRVPAAPEHTDEHR